MMEYTDLANLADVSRNIWDLTWSRDVARAMRIADRIEAGTVYINNYFNAATQSPVGGFKQSGYGRENGWEGMRCYLQTRSVWLSTNPHQPDPFAD